MTVRSFTFNPFATNLYVLASEGEAVIVDAASHRAHEHAAVVDAIRADGLVVKHLLLTHAHLDHIYGCAPLAEALGLGWALHRSELGLLRAAARQAQMFGAPIPEPAPEPTAFLDAGDTVAFGAATLEVLHLPGHSPGSLAFYSAADALVVAGDVLFRGSIGRTDLPGGDLPTLMRSIETGLLTLPDETRVLPGHGPATTVGEERRTNPFLT